MSAVNHSTVKISDKEYRVACPEGQEEKLSEVADLLNRSIGEAKSANAGVGSEQTITIAALNLTHELLEKNLAQRQQLQRENDAIKSCLQKISTQSTPTMSGQPTTSFEATLD